MRLMSMIVAVFVLCMPLLAKQDKEKKLNKKELTGFSKEDRGIMRDTLPPGLQKKVARGKPLPPGWEKKVRVGYRLPVEYHTHIEPVPVTVVRRLPPIGPNEEIVRVENKIIKMVKATKLIIDIFEL